MTSQRSVSSGGLGALDWLVLFAMGITAAAVAAGLIVHSGIAPIPSLIAAAALYMVMAASYLTILRSASPAGSSDGTRLAEIEEALGVIDSDLQRIDRVEDELARVNLLSERVEQIDRALSEGGASGLLAAPLPSSGQFASEFEDVHAKIETLRTDLEVETRSQREKISSDLKTLEGLMLKLSHNLIAREASPAPKPAPAPAAYAAQQEAEAADLADEDNEPEELPRAARFVETAESVEIVELDEPSTAPDLSDLAKLAEAPEDFYDIDLAYADDETEAAEEAASPSETVPEEIADGAGEPDAEPPARLATVASSSAAGARRPLPDDMAATLRQAVEGGRVDLYLQPTVTLPDRKLRYYEGLTRVRTPTDEVLKPDSYLAAAEDAGIMPLIDNVLIVKSVQVLRRLAPESKVKGIFCNISASSLLDRDFFPELVEFMEENSGLAESLVFEIGQPAFRAMSHTERAALDTLGALGYGFSLDHVTNLDIDFDGLRERFFRFVKIDANIFLNEMEQRGAVLPMAEMKDYIEDFDLKLIVEKVENERVATQLLDYGVDFAQGYLFGLPRLMSPALIREIEGINAA